MSQKTAPPKTSEAVTGAPADDLVDGLAVDERVAEELVADEVPEEVPYCCQIGRSRPRLCRTRATSAGVAALPHASAAGSAGMM